MSVNEVNKQTGDTSKIAGGTLYADAPIGAILAFGGATAPAGWLLCQGQAISRTTYAALFAVIGTAYGAGDGSTTFNLPDPREAALVGAGTNVLNAGSIAAHNAVSLGAFQDDQFQTHSHHVYINDDPNYPVRSNKNLKEDGGDYWNINPSGTYPIVASTEYEGNRAGATTHGKQLGVNYIIKAQQVALPADFATELNKKQNITDNTLQTTDKTVPGAINEINTALLPVDLSPIWSTVHLTNRQIWLYRVGKIVYYDFKATLDDDRAQGLSLIEFSSTSNGVNGIKIDQNGTSQNQKGIINIIRNSSNIMIESIIRQNTTTNRIEITSSASLENGDIIAVHGYFRTN